MLEVVFFFVFVFLNRLKDTYTQDKAELGSVPEWRPAVTFKSLALWQGSHLKTTIFIFFFLTCSLMPVILIEAVHVPF